MRLWASLFLVLVSCGPKKADSIPASGLSYSEKQAQYEDELFSKFINPQGFVVGRWQDGREASQGDSLLFTGLAMASLPCNKVEPMLAGYRNMLAATGGYFERILPLPESYNGNELSRDGVTGAFFALTRLWKECGIPEAETMMKNYADKVENATHLHPKKSSHALNTPSFNVFIKAVGKDKRVNGLENAVYYSGMAVTARSIMDSKSACFPLHLTTLQNIMMERTGEGLYRNQKSEWCGVVKGKGLILTDWYCREPLEQVTSWLEQSDYKHHYELQRCSWESGSDPNEAFPRVDWLVMHKLFTEGL